MAAEQGHGISQSCFNYAIEIRILFGSSKPPVCKHVTDARGHYQQRTKDSVGCRRRDARQTAHRPDCKGNDKSQNYLHFNLRAKFVRKILIAYFFASHSLRFWHLQCFLPSLRALMRSMLASMRRLCMSTSFHSFCRAGLRGQHLKISIRSAAPRPWHSNAVRLPVRGCEALQDCLPPVARRSGWFDILGPNVTGDAEKRPLPRCSWRSRPKGTL